MNYLKKFTAVAAPGITIAAPAYAHGSGLVLLIIGFPLLTILFFFYVIWSLYTEKAGKRFINFIQSLLIGVLWFAIFIAPLSHYQTEKLLRDHEEFWTIFVPLLLFISSWSLRKRLRKTHT